MNYSVRKFHYSHLLFFTLSLAVIIAFASWWFSPGHIPQNFSGPAVIFDWLFFILVSYVIWHPIIMDTVSWFISLFIKKLRRQKPLPGKKVAFITTIVPRNEPVELLHRCLPAMVNASYPHDTWILDEGNDDRVKSVCKMYGVKHFSRFGKEKFNTTCGKFTRTKGGNHNSWYETYGNEYDFVAQIDTDFVPKKNFLVKTLGYFRDPDIAFVGTPQIYGNTKNSFIAKGAFEQQYSFYGALLRGLSGMGMMLMIGANHIIRVSAFRKVDHYTAHITEDLITGIKLHAGGWKSIYVPQILAVGEGPSGWESYFNQQMRWAYGCIDILFHHSLKQFKKMPFFHSLIYFFLQQHYFAGLSMALSLALLSLYFFFGYRAADVDPFQFFLFYSVTLLTCWLMSVWLQHYNISRQPEKELQLTGKIISIAAWPIWFLALVSILTGKKLTYKVTPKGEESCPASSPVTLFLPHLVFAAIALLCLISAIFTNHKSPVMIFWALSSGIVMLTVPFIDRIANILKRFGQKIALRLPVVVNIDSEKTSSFLWEKVRDSIFLGLVVILSSLPYITKLGFYSDDWSFLGNFHLSKDQTIMGLYQTATTENTRMRPVQNFYDSLLYSVFKTDPLGYQIVNTLVFLCIIVLVYLILRRIGLPRIITLAVALVFSLLPNYSTDRFWYAAFQVNLSMLLYLFSLYSGMRGLAAETKKSIYWKILSIFCLIISILSYEVVLPLIFVNLLLFWNPLEKLSLIKNNRNQPLKNHAVFILINLIILGYLTIFKAKSTTRLGQFNYPGDITHLMVSIIKTNFGTLGVKVPYLFNSIIPHYLSPETIFLGVGLYFLILFYFYFLIIRSKIMVPGKKLFRILAVAGTGIFILGYAIFFANNRVGFSPTGIDNRVAIAASLGIALLAVGVIGWFGNLLFPPRAFRWFFCIIISLAGAAGFFFISANAYFWEQAYGESTQILTDIKLRLPQLPPKTTLIVDGICPYNGPGIVFESQWDLKGALQTIYHDETIKADVVTPRLKVSREGINTQIYTFRIRYPYQNLIIFNYRNKKTFPITGLAMARSYFRQYNPDFNNGCPNSSAGNGVSIF